MCVPALYSEDVDVFPHETGLLLPLLFSFPCGDGRAATILQQCAMLVAAAGS